MKMKKECKRVLLEGFETMLNTIFSAGCYVGKYEKEKNTQDIMRWNERRRDYHFAILEGIESLIEVEGE